MDWDKLRADLDQAVRQQSIAILDDAISYMQKLRAELESKTLPVDIEAITAPSAAPPGPPAALPPAVDPPAAHPPQPVPYKPPIKNDERYNTKGIRSRSCTQCGKGFFPKDGRVKACSEECRSARKKDYYRRWLRDTRPNKKTAHLPKMELPPDTGGDPSAFLDEPETVPITVAKSYSDYKRQPQERMLQSAPRFNVKKLRRHLGVGVIEPGTPEALAVIERVKQMPNHE